MMQRRRRWYLLFLIPPLFVLFVGLGGWVVMQLWNWLMPAVFDLPVVTFWQALGLLALSRILFGNFGPGRRGGGGPPWMRHRLAKRWDTLTPEERDRVRRSMRHGCGFDVEEQPSTATGA